MPWGGDTLLYNTKYLLVLAPKGGEDRTARRVIRKIYPGLEEEEIETYLAKDMGWV
jgi:hypothetical protein